MFRFSNMSRRLAFLQKYVNIFRIHLEWQLSIFLVIFMYHIENRGFRICHIKTKNKIKIKLQFVNYPCIFILFDNDIADIWIWSTYLVDYRNRKSFLNSCLPKNEHFGWMKKSLKKSRNQKLVLLDNICIQKIINNNHLFLALSNLHTTYA